MPCSHLDPVEKFEQVVGLKNFVDVSFGYSKNDNKSLIPIAAGRGHRRLVVSELQKEMRTKLRATERSGVDANQNGFDHLASVNWCIAVCLHTCKPVLQSD